MQDHYKQNKQTVITSGIVAKATIRKSNGRIEFIVVFQASTRQEFYWVFSARSKRSTRRTWKYAGYYPRELYNNLTAYDDFSSFVEHYARLHQAEVLAVRMYQKRRLSSLLSKTAHESIFADWSPQDVGHAKTDYLNHKVESRLKGHQPTAWRR